MGESFPPADGPPPPPAPPPQRGPAFQPQPSWPPPVAPPGLPPGLAPGPALARPSGPARPRGGRSLAGLFAAVAATALLVGGAAGFGGALLAGRTPLVSPPTSSAPIGPADPLPAAPAQADTVQIARRVLPATVMIQAGGSTGSGFVLDGSGRIMTNDHVVAGASDGGRIRVVLDDGRRLSATLVGRSPSYDIAVIKVPPTPRLPPLPVGDSDDTVVGQPVVAVGSPLGLPGTVTQGIVSARDRPVVVNREAAADAPTAYISAIQTDAPINPGNSGGPLVDSAGRVVGVNSAILTLGSGQGQTGNIGLGFAIPINQARQIGQQLIENGKARYPVIGATVADQTNGDGVRISSVVKDGPAAEAGLRASDVVTRVDGEVVTTMEELIVLVRTRRPGDTVELDYTRGSADRTASVTLGSKEG